MVRASSGQILESSEIINDEMEINWFVLVRESSLIIIFTGCKRETSAFTLDCRVPVGHCLVHSLDIANSTP